MLVILLTMAASLPVINTSIDPSSKVYNLARQVVKSAVEDLITRMSAYQCATALWYADARHKNIDFTGHAKEIENRIKNSLTQTASKSYNLELRSVSIAIPVAKIVISSTVWDGNPNSASAGKVEISMAVHVYVSFEYRIKNSGANFQKYTARYEEYLTIEGKGEIVKNEPWQGLPWVELALSFVPILGALVGNIKGVMFALPLTVTQYKALFNNQRVSPEVELDDLTRRLELVMLKPRDKVERFGGLTERYVGFTSIQYRFKTIRWVEYNKIDWGAIAIGIAIDLIIPGGRVVGTAAKVKQDITNDSPETLYFSVGGIGGGGVYRGMQNIWDNMVKKDIRKVEKIKENQKTTFGFHKDQQADVVLQYYEKLAKEGKKVLEDKAIQQTLGQIEATVKAVPLEQQSQWKYAFEQYKNRVKEYSENIYGTYMRTEGIELYQSTSGGGKIMDYYANRNPLVWVGLPLHNGKSLFGVCVWLIGAYYPGDA
jgi:hypothetical protein